MKTYEEMKALWESDPEEFERRRTEMIEGIISGAPRESQTALRQLQWRIDGICAKAKNPLQRLQFYQDFFMEAVYGENGTLRQIISNCGEIEKLVKENLPEKNEKLKVIK
ncbi:MAG TPA: hypothetical protein DD454_00600 [Candidatus Moranbacteria bacterium]|nr:hypothetical protein [Candidatus Moranbacteria bacterium]